MWSKLQVLRGIFKKGRFFFQGGGRKLLNLQGQNLFRGASRFRGAPPCGRKPVGRLHVQIRLMRIFGLNGSVPWLTNTDGELCLFCKNSVEDVSHFLSDCSSFGDNFESIWSNLQYRPFVT